MSTSAFIDSPPHSSAESRPERGFSLIEILIALAIIAITGTAISINFGGITSKERLRAAARKLAGTSDYIRSHAASRKQPCYLDIDFDRSRYRFRQDPKTDPYGQFIDGDSGQFMTEDELTEWRESFDWEALPLGVHFKSLFYSPKRFYHKNIISIRYKPNGTLDTYILHLQTARSDDDDDTLWYSVSVNGLSGKAEVLSYKAVFPEADESDFKQVMGHDAPGAGR